MLPPAFIYFTMLFGLSQLDISDGLRIVQCNATASDAWSYCRYEGLVLATTRNKTKTQDLITEMSNANVSLVWIGLYIVPVNCQPVWMDGRCMSKYTLGRVKRLNRNHSHNCVLVSQTGELESEDCSAKHYFACDAPSQLNSATNPPFLNTSCSLGNKTNCVCNESSTGTLLQSTDECVSLRSVTTPIPGTHPATTTAASAKTETVWESTTESPIDKMPTTAPTSSSTTTALSSIFSTNGFIAKNGSADTTTQETTDTVSTTTSAGTVSTTTSTGTVLTTTSAGTVLTTTSAGTVSTTTSAGTLNTNMYTKITTENIAFTGAAAQDTTDAMSATSSPGTVASTPVTTSGTTRTTANTSSVRTTTHEGGSLLPTKAFATTIAKKVSTFGLDSSSVGYTFLPPSKPDSTVTDGPVTSPNDGGELTAEQATKLVMNKEREFLKKAANAPLRENNDDYQLEIKPLPESGSDEANPLASFGASSVNGLTPSNGETQSVLAVMAEIRLKKRSLEMLNGNSTIKTSNYNNSHYVLNNSRILSITAVQLTPSETKVIDASVSFTFDLKEDRTLEEMAHPKATGFFSFHQETVVTESVEVACRYLDAEKLELSGNGCISKMSINPGRALCECSHTTAFAVLLSVRTFTIPAGVKILSLICESMSTFFLALTLIVLMRVKKHVRNDRTMMQMNLAVSLLLFHVCNLFHDLAINHPTSCEVVAVLVHYFLLSSASWMLVEGVTMFRKTAGAGINSRRSWYEKSLPYMTGWGVPACIVVLAAGIGLRKQTYMQINPMFANPIGPVAGVTKYKHCWISPKYGVLQGALLAPVLIVLIVNGIIVARMGHFVYMMSTRAEEFKPTHQRSSSRNNRACNPARLDLYHLKASLKAVTLLMPVLGLPWILGILAGIDDNEASVTFMYLNTIVNGLQGVSIFFIYCALSTEVRNALKAIRRRNRAGSKLSDDRSLTFGRESFRIRPKTSHECNKIFGVHNSTAGKFSEIPL